MRQAGRSLPEYRALRGEGTILDAIAKPDLAAEITLQPVPRYGVDAAILYSDIVVPVSAIGFGVDIAPGTGPVVEHPFRPSADLDRLRPLEPELDTPYVLETIRILVGELDVPLIGFAGAPFTVASYLIEGRPSRTYARTKALMHGDPALWHALMERLADLAVSSLRSQVDAGAERGAALRQLGRAISARPTTGASCSRTRPGSSSRSPTSTSPASTSASTPASCSRCMAATGPEVVGVDWRIPLDEAGARLGPAPRRAGQPRPGALPRPVAGRRATRSAAILAEGARHPGGHIFNLGHGVLPETDPSVLERIVDVVHAAGRDRRR